MKILIFGGGLGNQIFGYAFKEYMRCKYPLHKIYGVYSKYKLNEHFGIEIDKWFEVQLPPSKWYITFFTYSLYLIKKLTGWQKMLDLNQVVAQNENAMVHFAFHTDKKYIPEGDWLNFKITDEILGKRNLGIINEIKKSNSVFIHVRRGDYLSPKYKDYFYGCCTLDYYIRSIDYMKSKVENPIFFVFSNDIKWAKDNLPLDNPIFIDWNNGANSPLDMYLMAQCQNGIIANSSFSYWGAKLNQKINNVTYPEKWINPPAERGDIIPEGWVEL